MALDPYAFLKGAGTQGVTVGDLTAALFVPGDRYGWLARDILSEIRPYPEPQPVIDDDWVRSYQVLQAAVTADSGFHPFSSRARAESQRLRDEFAQRTEFMRETFPRLQEKWVVDYDAWYRSEWSRAFSRPQHVPFCLERVARRADIVGGDQFGWQCLLTTLGSSILAAGARLEVLDVTEQGCAAMLVGLCELTRAVEVHHILLPEQAAGVDLFEDLTSDSAVSVLVEALSAHTADRAERLLDRRILEETFHHLKPPVTPARLAAALRLLLRGTRTAEVAALISDDDFDALQTAFPDEQREGMRERLTLLEATMHALSKYGIANVLPRTKGAPGLHCIALSGTDVEVVNEMLVDLITQMFIRRMTTDSTSTEAHDLIAHSATPKLGVHLDRTTEHGTAPRDTCAVILGAERIAPRHLEKLSGLAAAGRFRLVLFFSSLDSEVTERAAHHADVLGIMRLTNHAQAERAASLIGSEYKMTFTGLALTEGRSKTLNWGWSFGQSRASMVPLGLTTSEQESGGIAIGANTSEQRTNSRVHELIVEPEGIQQLGSTALELIQFGARGDRRRISLDVHPLRALGP